MAQMSASQRYGREEQIQFLRFLAFLMVFCLHAEQWIWFSYPGWNGAVSAVSFFVILSGAMTGYGGYYKEQELTWRAVVTDVWRRLRKLYPLYFLSVFFSVSYFGLPGVLVNHDFWGAIPLLKVLVRHLLLLQSWFPDGYFDYNGVGWYLSTIFFLYFLNIPLLTLLKKMERSTRAGLLYLLSISLCLVGTCVYSIVTYAGDAHFMQYICPLARIGQYFTGMVLGYIMRPLKEKHTDCTRGKQVCTVAEVAALGMWAAALFLPEETWHNRLVDWMIPCVLVIGIFLWGQGRVSDLFRWKPLVRLGDISFECYLFHQIIITVFVKLSGVQPNTVFGNLLCLGSCLAGTLLLAFCFNRRALPQTGR